MSHYTLYADKKFRQFFLSAYSVYADKQLSAYTLYADKVNQKYIQNLSDFHIDEQKGRLVLIILS